MSYPPPDGFFDNQWQPPMGDAEPAQFGHEYYDDGRSTRVAPYSSRSGFGSPALPNPAYNATQIHPVPSPVHNSILRYGDTQSTQTMPHPSWAGFHSLSLPNHATPMYHVLSPVDNLKPDHHLSQYRPQGASYASHTLPHKQHNNIGLSFEGMAIPCEPQDLGVKPQVAAPPIAVHSATKSQGKRASENQDGQPRKRKYTTFEEKNPEIQAGLNTFSAAPSRVNTPSVSGNVQRLPAPPQSIYPPTPVDVASRLSQVPSNGSVDQAAINSPRPASMQPTRNDWRVNITTKGLVYGRNSKPLPGITPGKGVIVRLLRGPDLEALRLSEGSSFYGNELYNTQTGERYVLRITDPADMQPTVGQPPQVTSHIHAGVSRAPLHRAAHSQVAAPVAHNPSGFGSLPSPHGMQIPTIRVEAPSPAASVSQFQPSNLGWTSPSVHSSHGMSTLQATSPMPSAFQSQSPPNPGWTGQNPDALSSSYGMHIPALQVEEPSPTPSALPFQAQPDDPALDLDGLFDDYFNIPSPHSPS